MKTFLNTMIAGVFLVAGAQGASAQMINECDWQASARNIAEPWSENTRMFAEGKVRLALVDTIEPAAAAFHILVLSPPYDEVGARQCKVISLNESFGFTGIEFSKLEARYDPAVGLIFEVPAFLYGDDGTSSTEVELAFWLNQSTGELVGEIFRSPE
ncbi:hypothetical protein [Halocynthiibacter sp.]|uniref:hypothetical protein n=1 Tax=Halocynthiibacter sp. TaxID=1979210 RepID=UPI003C4F49E3